MQKNFTNIFCALNEARDISERIDEIKNNGFNLNKEAFPMINPLSQLTNDISALKVDNLGIYEEIKKRAERINMQFNDLNKEKINIIGEEIKEIEHCLFNLLKF